MKIMMIGTEATPFAKTGGLADVLGSLPKALSEMGHEVCVVLPKHQTIKEHYDERLKFVDKTRIKVRDKKEYAGFEVLTHEGVNFYFVDNEYYFGYRENLYGDFDDGERYGFFNHAALALVERLHPDADVLHLHDWPAGLIPYILKATDLYPKTKRRAKTLFTIHNIAYQGHFDRNLLPYLNVPYAHDLEYGGAINFLKCAIVTSDALSTVSETYAEELQYAYFGYGMEDLLHERADDFKGIMNGIDYSEFDPKNDPYIAKNYGLHNYLKGKAENKQALLKMFHLENLKKPLLGIVSRLTDQKGFTLLSDALEPLLKEGRIQCVVLGTGDEELHDFFDALRKKYPKHLGLYFGYSDKIARQVYAGADFFLMPSRYEPCGLAQLISFRYGTLPIVRMTGGLKDSVEPYNKYTGTGNGFGFQNFDGSDLLRTLFEALEAYENKDHFKKLMRRAMREDFSWRESAKQYDKLYESLKGGTPWKL